MTSKFVRFERWAETDPSDKRPIHVRADEVNVVGDAGFKLGLNRTGCHVTELALRGGGFVNVRGRCDEVVEMLNKVESNDVES